MSESETVVPVVRARHTSSNPKETSKSKRVQRNSDNSLGIRSSVQGVPREANKYIVTPSEVAITTPSSSSRTIWSGSSSQNIDVSPKSSTAIVTSAAKANASAAPITTSGVNMNKQAGGTSQTQVAMQGGQSDPGTANDPQQQQWVEDPKDAELRAHLQERQRTINDLACRQATKLAELEIEHKKDEAEKLRLCIEKLTLKKQAFKKMVKLSDDREHYEGYGPHRQYLKYEYTLDHKVMGLPEPVAQLQAKEDARWEKKMALMKARKEALNLIKASDDDVLELSAKKAGQAQGTTHKLRDFDEFCETEKRTPNYKALMHKSSARSRAIDDKKGFVFDEKLGSGKTLFLGFFVGPGEQENLNADKPAPRTRKRGKTTTSAAIGQSKSETARVSELKSVDRGRKRERTTQGAATSKRTTGTVQGGRMRAITGTSLSSQNSISDFSRARAQSASAQQQDKRVRFVPQPSSDETSTVGPMNDRADAEDNGPKKSAYEEMQDIIQRSQDYFLSTEIIPKRHREATKRFN